MGENGSPDIKTIIGAIAARHGLFFKPSDPAFAIVTINEMLVERIANEFLGRIDSRLREFETSFAQLQGRAGKLLAQDVKDAAGEIRSELQRDIESARLNASELVNRIEGAHARRGVARWVAVGIACGAGLFLAGFCCGIYHPF